MIRKRLGNIILFSILSAILIVASGLLFNWMSNLRQLYWDIYYGERVDAMFSIYENCERTERRLWRFRFMFAGEWYTGVTAGIYACPNPRVQGGYWWIGTQNTGVRIAEIEEGENYVNGINDGSPYWLLGGYWWVEGVNTGIRANMRGQQVRLMLENGRPITYPIGQEPNYIRLGDRKYSVVTMAREDGYFRFFDPPNFAMPLVAVGLLCLTLFGVLYNLIFVLKDKRVVRHGTFAYALIEDNFWSKLGSRRWQAIRFRYQDEEGQWQERVSHYTFRPSQVVYLRSLEAIEIKYLGERAVIIERFSNKGPIDPPF